MIFYTQQLNAESCIEIVVITTNKIGACLRLSLVTAKQLEEKKNDIEIRYLSQAEREKVIT